ncbi:hypothetical protein [Granulicoccus sp. GXG6511]|uniref:hypothetical protein n=1 Tax=Granulicoccus sp. GXG6511 TaxID=3381351 RepID=UPI003D7ECE6B
MAADADPVLGREPRTLRWWVVAAVVTTVIALGVIVATTLLSRQPPWDAVPVPTGQPT